MEIKTVVQTRKKPPLRYFISILLNWSWWHKWVVAGLFFVMLISGISVACVYIGIQFSNTGKATTLKGWMNFVVGDTFSIAQTYARSFWIDAEEISIDISFKNLSKLEQKRREALRRGVLVPLPTDWVPAKIKHRNNIYKVSVKLKGQLHDHWKDPKEWSLKVKVKNGKTIFGMRRFALQAPRTRVYLNEWVHHKILKNFGLIGLRYKFVELTVNGEKRPIYQIEENFDEILIENNKRPEGPLFRLRHARFRIGSEGLSSQFAGGAIIPFQKNRLIKNDKLLKQFIYSKNLFEGFRTGKLKASEVFDLPKLTMVFAINDLF